MAYSNKITLKSAIDSRKYLSYIVLEEETNQSNNSSKVRWTLYLSSTKNYYKFSDYRIGYDITIGNYSTKLDWNTSSTPYYSIQTAGDTIKIASGVSSDIKHNSDGTKSVGVSAKVLMSTGSSAPLDASKSISGTYTLTKLNVYTKATIKANKSSYSVGDTPIFTITNKNSNLAYDISLVANGLTWNYKNITISSNGEYSNFTIPFTAIKGLKITLTCNVTLTTRNGSNVIGTSTTSFTISIPSKYTLVSFGGKVPSEFTSKSFYFDTTYAVNVNGGISGYTWDIKFTENNNLAKLPMSNNYVSLPSRWFPSNTKIGAGDARETTLTLFTYSGNTTIGSLDYKIKFKLNNINNYEGIIESITPKLNNIYNLENDYWITDKSNIDFTIEGITKSSSYFSELFIDDKKTPFTVLEKEIGTGDLPEVQNKIKCNKTLNENVPNNFEFEFKVKDSRGIETSKQYSLTTEHIYYATYIAPSITGLNYNKGTSNLTFTLRASNFGNNYPSDFTVKINDSLYTCNIGEQQTISYTVDSSNYTDITVVFKYLGEEIQKTISIPPEEKPVNINFSKRSVGIGKSANLLGYPNKWNLEITGGLYLYCEDKNLKIQLNDDGSLSIGNNFRIKMSNDGSSLSIGNNFKIDNNGDLFIQGKKVSVESGTKEWLYLASE